MNCQQAKKSLYLFIDRELEQKANLEVQTHLDSCPLCSLEFESEKKIESVIREKILRDKAPLALKERVIEQIELQEVKSSSWTAPYSFLRARARYVFAIVAVFTITIALFFLYRTMTTPYFPVFQEAVKDHTNFLAGRLPLEIVSSESEVVSSWFEGKLDFSVAVLEFPGEEMELLGGRLGRLKDREVAYLFYRSGRHKISFVVHDCSGLRLPRVKRIEAHGRKFDVTSLKGYTVVHWQDHEMGCTVVSDMDEQSLLELLSGALSVSA